MKHDVFISYRRDGGEYTAKILRDRLDELGYAVFFDVESLRSGDFNTKLYSVIEECKDFILVLSPGALDRCRNEDDWVRREVEYALERGKNIVPVMLRGFEFPEVLPSSMEQLRFKNGIPANTEFFEAFIQKLQSFLRARPPFWRRITQNTVFKRTLPVFLALALLAAIGLGGYALWNRSAGAYPRTAAEKNLVTELLYYVETDMTQLNLMADSVNSALEEAQRYLSGGSVSTSALENQFELTRSTLERADLSGSAPSDRLLDLLADSPFSAAEFVAMYDCTVAFSKEWADYLTHIEWAIGPSSGFSVSNKMKIVSCYQSILDETMRASAYAANEMLLPITDNAALDDLLHRYLPTVSYIPLSAASWSRDKAALVSVQNECVNKLQAALQDLTSITGEQSLGLAVRRAELIEQYMAAGATRSQAEQYVEQIIAILNEAYETFSPKEGDTEEILWAKLRAFVAIELYDGAVTCADALGELAEEDAPNAAKYLPGLLAFLHNIDSTGIDYGVMVTAYYEPDGVNEVFEIGDVIVEFNGAPCHNYEEYTAGKDGLSGPSYTVGVLRHSGSGGLEHLTLELTRDMPRVVLQALSNRSYE